MTNDSSGSVRDAVRAFNKHVLNPVMLHFALHKHFYAGVVRHIGRRSGKPYVTPAVVDRVADGFILPLAYGSTGGATYLTQARRG